MIIDFFMNGLCIENHPLSQQIPTLYKIKVNDIFGNKNQVNLRNFNAMILNLFLKFNHPFSHVFIFGNMFPESYSFIAMPVTSCIKDTC